GYADRIDRSRRSQPSRSFRLSEPSYRPAPPHMTLFEQVADMPVEIQLGHVLSSVVISDDGPALPLLEALKALFCPYPLPGQQTDEVAQEQLDVLAGEASGGLVVALVL